MERVVAVIPFEAFGRAFTPRAKRPRGTLKATAKSQEAHSWGIPTLCEKRKGWATMLVLLCEGLHIDNRLGVG